MSKSKTWLAAAVLVAVSTAGTLARAKDDDGETEIKLSDCPRAVQKTLEREAHGAKIEEVEKETEDGKTVYEAEVVIDGKEYEIEVAEDGTLLQKKLEQDDDDDDKGDGKDDDDKRGR